MSIPIPQSNSVAPKKEVEDIFATLEKPKTTAVPARPPVMTAQNYKQFYEEPVLAKSPGRMDWGRIFKIAAIPLFFLLLFVSIAAAVPYIFKSSNKILTADQYVPPPESIILTPPANTAEIAPVVETPASALNPNNPDMDFDGLTNEKETQLGTDQKNLDTDIDGLFDGEEVNTYKTDPLNKDTDGDGYEDGKEVKTGYDPNGTGMLLDFAAAIKQIK